MQIFSLEFHILYPLCLSPNASTGTHGTPQQQQRLFICHAHDHNDGAIGVQPQQDQWQHFKYTPGK